MIIFYIFHIQWEDFFQIEFHPRMKFYSFHPGMKLMCKQKFFHYGTSFIPGRDFISIICKRTLKQEQKILFTREFRPGIKRVEFHPGMKFDLKENLPLSMKTW